MVDRWLSAMALGAALLVAPASAIGQDHLRPAVEQVQAHQRVALGYLQTGNADLAIVELERLRDFLMTEGTGRPWVESEPTLAAAFAAARAKVMQSIEAAEGGDLDRARVLMSEANAYLHSWRRAVGLTLFSDCIARASQAYEALDVYRRQGADLADPAVRQRIVAASDSTKQALAQCDTEAAPTMRDEPEFRRLMDGFTASLRLVNQAVESRNGDDLHRLLIEQRAFERLLAFRFG